MYFFIFQDTNPIFLFSKSAIESAQPPLSKFPVQSGIVCLCFYNWVPNVVHLKPNVQCLMCDTLFILMYLESNCFLF